jgi:Na+-translocating ferredoxin:NAD+ oxidoreductase RNF subunit RnfB
MTNRFSRRQFLKLGALVAGAFTTLGAARSRAFDDLLNAVGDSMARLPAFRADAQTTGELIAANGEPMQHLPTASAAAPAKHRWVMVIDLAKCDGCKECTAACGAMHFVPPGQEWIKVFQNRDNNVAAAYWFPRPCMQ